MKTITVSAMLVALLLGGCTTTEQAVVTGAGVGAMVGHNFGDGSGDRDKGALVGAVLGGMVGSQLEQQQRQMHHMQQQAATTTVWIDNSNGSRTPVRITQGPGGTWIGPRGEHYTSMPSPKQLKMLYGM